MKIVVTGSLGNISKPLTQELVQKGHTVTVISSNAESKKKLKLSLQKQPLASWKMPIF